MNHAAIKQLLISLGLYREARLLHRRLNRREMDTYLLDRQFYSDLLSRGPVLCFDVGANIGRVSEVLLELGHEVIAFEPQPRCIREIQARCSRKDHLHIERCALGDTPGKLSLFVRESSGQSSLRKSWEGQITSSIEVPVSTLDKAIGQFGIPQYCKIDVEGWEIQVLHGLSRPIPLISFEFHQSEGFMDEADACLDYLSSLATISVNITPREESRLALDEWVDRPTFKSTFRSRFQGKNDFLYGDIYVRMLVEEENAVDALGSVRETTDILSQSLSLQ